MIYAIRGLYIIQVFIFFFLYRLLEARKNQHTYQNSLLRFEIHLHADLFSNKHMNQDGPFKDSYSRTVSNTRDTCEGVVSIKMEVLIKSLVFAKMSGVFSSV